jgi:hypothetical protein
MKSAATSRPGLIGVGGVPFVVSKAITACSMALGVMGLAGNCTVLPFGATMASWVVSCRGGDDRDDGRCAEGWHGERRDDAGVHFLELRAE